MSDFIIEQEITIEAQGYQIVSQLQVEDAEKGQKVLICASIVDGVTEYDRLMIPQSVGYSDEQFQYDVERFRHAAADKAIAVVNSARLAALIQPSAEPVAVVQGLRYQKPTPIVQGVKDEVPVAVPEGLDPVVL